jgi:hypothetical protein
VTDPETLAARVIDVLLPALPNLRRITSGAETLEPAHRLWLELRPKIEARPAARAAVGRAAREASPDVGGLRQHMAELLRAEPAAAERIAEIVGGARG